MFLSAFVCLFVSKIMQKQLDRFFFKIRWKEWTLSYIFIFTHRKMVEQEAQLMLTNPRDEFRGQSRSPNMVPFHISGILSSCAIVTLSLNKTCRFLDIRLQNMS